MLMIVYLHLRVTIVIERQSLKLNAVSLRNRHVVQQFKMLLAAQMAYTLSNLPENIIIIN